MKTVYIMSAKFAPGHFSHMLAFYKAFKAVGIAPCLLLDRQYAPFVMEVNGYKFRYLDDKNVKAPDLLFIYNLSLYDNSISKALKKQNKNMRIFFVYHEPWYGITAWFKDLKSGNESLKDSIKALGRYWAARGLLGKCDKILVPSRKAAENYNKFCLKYNKNYDLFPLIFTDERTDKMKNMKREYFSFISTASNSKNFGKFIEFIKFRSENDSKSKFQIATRTDISNYLDDDLTELINQGRLIVNHGHDLTNEEINFAYAKATCVWMLYVRSTQSGSLCKSFMFGTPVIASDIGSFRESVDGNNGIIIPLDSDLNTISRSYDKILAEFEFYSDNARLTFEKNFYYFNKIEDLEKLVQF